LGYWFFATAGANPNTWSPNPPGTPRA